MTQPQRTATASPAQLLQTWYRERRIRPLARALFNERLTPGQAGIVHTILYGEHKRICVSAYTQYGKTWCVALAVCLLFLFTRQPIEVQVISATKAQAERFRQYLAGFILNCGLLANDLELEAKGAERIRKEVSKDRLTFRTGHSISIQTAHGSADRLMGLGGDIIIKDEAGLIKPEADAKILRMLGGRADGTIIELGNPWSRLSSFFKSWSDPAYHTIRIGWQQGVAEGRITEAFVEEQRRRLPPIMFQVQYDSTFPEDVEDALFRWSWIEAAIHREALTRDDGGKPEWGLDIAEHGADKTVLTVGLRAPGRVSVTKIHAWAKVDTMQTVARTQQHVDAAWPGRGDANGLGAGVVSRLKELGYGVEAYRSSNKPRDARFRDRKAEDYWRLRTLLEQGSVPGSMEWLSLPSDDPHLNDLVRDLTRARYEVRNGRTVVFHEGEDQAGGSPDFSDSLVMMIAAPGGSPPSVVRKPGGLRAARGFQPGSFIGKG